MKKCSRIVVKGKVHELSYGDFVKKSAQECKIEGTVQNGVDGTIIINACGDTEHFDDFIDALYQGPPQSNIEEVIEEPIETGRDFRGVFRIIRTN